MRFAELSDDQLWDIVEGYNDILDDCNSFDDLSAEQQTEARGAMDEINRRQADLPDVMNEECF